MRVAARHFERAIELDPGVCPRHAAGATAWSAAHPMPRRQQRNNERRVALHRARPRTGAGPRRGGGGAGARWSNRASSLSRACVSAQHRTHARLRHRLPVAGRAADVRTGRPDEALMEFDARLDSTRSRRSSAMSMPLRWSLHGRMEEGLAENATRSPNAAFRRRLSHACRSDGTARRSGGRIACLG